MTRGQIIAEARKWDGTKFRHQGRGPEGIDCAGILVNVGRALGKDVKDDLTYARIPDTAKLKKVLLENLRQKPLNERKPGDVLLFKDRFRRGHMYHLGILTSAATFIHAYSGMGVNAVVEIPLSPDWEAAIVGVFEYPEVED